jgi:hypothetical protein
MVTSLHFGVEFGFTLAYAKTQTPTQRRPGKSYSLIPKFPRYKRNLISTTPQTEAPHSYDIGKTLLDAWGPADLEHLDPVDVMNWGVGSDTRTIIAYEDTTFEQAKLVIKV